MKKEISEKDAFFLYYCQLAFLGWIAKFFRGRANKAHAQTREFEMEPGFYWHPILAFAAPVAFGCVLVFFVARSMNEPPQKEQTPLLMPQLAVK